MKIDWEKVSDLLRDGLADLTDLHWQECRTFDRMLNVNWQRYIELESAGTIQWIGVRMGEKLVGYASVSMTNPLHHQHERSSMTDTIYLSPEYRKGLAGWKMIKAVVGMLQERRVQFYTFTERKTVFHKLGDFRKVMKRLGFELYEYNWIIKIGV